MDLDTKQKRNVLDLHRAGTLLLVIFAFEFIAWTISSHCMAKEEELNPLLKAAIALSLPLIGLLFSSSTLATNRSLKRPHKFQEQITYPLESLKEESAAATTEAVVSPETKPEIMSSTVQYNQTSGSESMFVKFCDDERSSSSNSKDCNYNIIEDEFFHQFSCGSKEQEVLFQKMQIMCLGYKLEAMEVQNQRLEAAIVEHRAGIDQLDGIREELTMVEKKVKKLVRTSKARSTAIHDQSLALSAGETQLQKAKEELTQAMKEVEDIPVLASSLNPASTTSESKEELLDVQNMKKLQNKEILDQLRSFQDNWHGEMEELLYLGWIGACLKHEILMYHEEEVGEETEGEEVRDNLMTLMEVPSVTGNVDHCLRCRAKLHKEDTKEEREQLTMELPTFTSTNHEGEIVEEERDRLIMEFPTKVLKSSDHGHESCRAEVHEEEIVEEERSQLMMELPASTSNAYHGESCRAHPQELELAGNSLSSSVSADLGLKKPNAVSSSKGKHCSGKKPRLLYKIKRWANGKA